MHLFYFGIDGKDPKIKLSAITEDGNKVRTVASATTIGKFSEF
jgi:hypothetical protein